ncbi:MAG: type II toxin-antitoxin system Phd/YefM family antitoxin [Myxococcales bacterium]|nr:type II toxin-antitoxin system Phd/YefM family antitoxin [Myxococcales bacterium]
MNWSVAEAKAKFSEVLVRSREAPQVIESRGKPIAVVLPVEEYSQLKERAAERGPGAIAAWLAKTEELKREGELELRAPRRVPRSGRGDPFGRGR